MGRQQNLVSFIKKNSSLTIILIILMLSPIIFFLVSKNESEDYFFALSENDKKTVFSTLQEHNLTFVETLDGISVGQAEVDAVKGIINEEVGAASLRTGYELFQNNQIGLSEISKRVSFTRAIQGELEKTILLMNGVQNVRVHVSLPEKSRLGKLKERGRAAVYLKTADSEQVELLSKSIKQLVIASVPGITKENVSIISDRAVGSSIDVESLPKTLQIQAYLEGVYRDKSIALMSKLYPSGPYIVEVTVGVSTETKKLEKTTPITANKKVTGVLTHSKVRTVSSVAENNKEKTDVTEKNYHVGTLNEYITSDDFVVTRVTVGVFLAKKVLDDDLDVINKVLSSALGIQSSRGDEIIMAAILPEPATIVFEKENNDIEYDSVPEKIVLSKVESIVSAGSFSFISIFFLMLLFMVRQRYEC
jgi:flagellar M-ring protein FliF